MLGNGFTSVRAGRVGVMAELVWRWSDEDVGQVVSVGVALERLYAFAVDELTDDDERGPFLAACRDLLARELGLPVEP